ncbi:MAG: nitrophenyl compound nitroreductase subunit ArsF family protein [Salinivirgaceae bacterium]|jgi:hypothetical protein
MKTMKWMLVVVLFTSQLQACNAQSGDNKKASVENQGVENKGVQVYYFHYTRRCATCNAVEEVTKKSLEEIYGNKVSFASVNLDETQSEELAKKLNIEGQTLLIVNDAERFDLTNEAFMNVNSKPENLKALIKKTIDPLL